MSGAKALGLVIALAAAAAVGFFARPYVHAMPMTSSALSAPANMASTPAATPKAPRPAVAAMARAPITPALGDRLHPLFNQGTNVSIAAEGFANGLQFAEVTHAARNVDVPFVVLKDKVVRRHESLARAIHDLKPQVNASIEANRATAEARSDVAATRGV